MAGVKKEDQVICENCIHYKVTCDGNAFKPKCKDFKNKKEGSAPTEPDPEETKSTLPEKDFFRVDEVMMYFGVTDRCVRNWIDHGHLTARKVVGTIQIERESIINCALGNKVKAQREQAEPAD